MQMHAHMHAHTPMHKHTLLHLEIYIVSDRDVGKGLGYGINCTAVLRDRWMPSLLYGFSSEKQITADAGNLKQNPKMLENTQQVSCFLFPEMQLALLSISSIFVFYIKCYHFDLPLLTNG